MAIETIWYQGKRYPNFQTTGFAARFAFPFAKEVCFGNGFDIGYSKLEWKFPGAIGIDEGKMAELGGEKKDLNVSANHLPCGAGHMDYIFSSHCLEHIPDWVATLNYWKEVLKPAGTLFLYLPHPDQEYWRPWNNRKHIHVLYPSTIREYLENCGWANVFVSERDLNHSFMAIAEKI